MARYRWDQLILRFDSGQFQCQAKLDGGCAADGRGRSRSPPSAVRSELSIRRQPAQGDRAAALAVDERVPRARTVEPTIPLSHIHHVGHRTPQPESRYALLRALCLTRPSSSSTAPLSRTARTAQLTSPDSHLRAENVRRNQAFQINVTGAMGLANVVKSNLGRFSSPPGIRSTRFPHSTRS